MPENTTKRYPQELKDRDVRMDTEIDETAAGVEWGDGAFREDRPWMSRRSPKQIPQWLRWPSDPRTSRIASYPVTGSES